MGEVPDQLLIRRVVAGDERAFRTLYREHTPRLYRTALRYAAGRASDAEDLVQECWTRAVRGLAGFEGRSALGTWLVGIVTRCAWERYRNEQDSGGGEQARSEQSPPPDRVASRIDLERAFAELPFGARSVLALHDIEGFRHREIAELLEISVGTSKSQLSRARALMRAHLGEDYARR